MNRLHRSNYSKYIDNIEDSNNEMCGRTRTMHNVPDPVDGYGYESSECYFLKCAFDCPFSILNELKHLISRGSYSLTPSEQKLKNIFDKWVSYRFDFLKKEFFKYGVKRGDYAINNNGIHPDTFSPECLQYDSILKRIKKRLNCSIYYGFIENIEQKVQLFDCTESEKRMTEVILLEWKKGFTKAVLDRFGYFGIK